MWSLWKKTQQITRYLLAHNLTCFEGHLPPSSEKTQVMKLNKYYRMMCKLSLSSLKFLFKKIGCWPIFISTRFLYLCCHGLGKLLICFATHPQAESGPNLHHILRSQLSARKDCHNHSCWNVAPILNCCFLSPDGDRSA